MGDPAPPARSWLRKAQHDQRAAAMAVGADPPLTEIAAFHAQQQAEKAIKAWLVLHGLSVPRIHMVEALLDLCIDAEPNLAGLLDDARLLSPYAVASRYPGVDPDVSPAEAREAVDAANRIWEAFLALLPEETHP